MPVLTKERIREITETLPTVKYPEHVLKRLDEEYEVAMAQLVSGELKPMSVAEYARKKGIALDDLDDFDDEEC